MQKKGNHEKAGHNYAERAMGVIGLHVNPRSGKQSSAVRTPVHPTAAEPAQKKSSGWLQTIEDRMKGSSQPQTATSGSGKGVLAAGAAGAAAGVATGSRGTAKKVPAKKMKKTKPAAQKKKKSGTPKKKHSKKNSEAKHKKKSAKKHKKLMYKNA